MPLESTPAARGGSGHQAVARLARSKRRRPSAVLASVALALAVGVALPLVLSSSGAGAASVTTLRARAAAIAQRIDTLQTKLQILSEEFDQAEVRSSAITKKIRNDEAALSHTERKVGVDGAKLRKQAIAAYMSDGSATGLSVLSSNPNALPLQQTYLAVASSSLDSAITSLHDAQHQLDVRHAVLAKAEHSARQTVSTIGDARRSAMTLESQLNATQSEVSGALKNAVAQEEAAREAAAQRAAAATARKAAAQPPPPAPSAAAPVVVSTPTAPSTPAASGGGSGAVAVAAAESQIGVPYVWGGATPGVGFDCSGLVMWAWSQAGVSLPHDAMEQYEDTEHISFSQLQPGDLIFYASGGYVYHVIMYIGGGQAVQAEETGTNIQITPVWPGAFAAGRP